MLADEAVELSAYLAVLSKETFAECNRALVEIMLAEIVRLLVNHFGNLRHIVRIEIVRRNFVGEFLVDGETVHVLAVAFTGRAGNLSAASARAALHRAAAAAVGTGDIVIVRPVTVNRLAVAVGVYIVSGYLIPGFALLYLSASAAATTGISAVAAAVGADYPSAAAASGTGFNVVGTGHLEGLAVMHELIRGEKIVAPHVHI